MTEQNSTPEPGPVEVDFDDAFGDWLKGAGVAQQSVAIHSKPHLMGQFQELERRAKLEQGIAAQDASQADEADMSPALKAEYEALYAEWMASKSTWYVRALSDKDRALINAPTPHFDPLPDDATDDDKKARRAAVEKAQTDLNLRTIAVATVRIVFGDERVVHMPPVESLEGLLAAAEKLRPMITQVGERAGLDLMEAVATATQGEADIPAPKSLTPSRNGQG